MFTIITRVVNGVTVLDLSRGAMALRDVVQKELDNGSNRILLNFRENAPVDSAALRELAESYASALERGGEMRVCAPKNVLPTVAEIAKLNVAAKVFDNEQEALNSFPLRAAA